VLEAIFLALTGGLLGCLLAFTMNGVVAGAGGPNFSEMAFAFHITSRDILNGLIFAVTMGIIGGLLPAFRAAKLPITSALREA